MVVFGPEIRLLPRIGGIANELSVAVWLYLTYVDRVAKCVHFANALHVKMLQPILLFLGR